MKEIKLTDGSNLKIEVLSCFCGLKIFEINGIKAYSYDFGTQEDIAPDDAYPYCCGDMQFIPKESTPKVLNKYRITQAEYEQICEELDCLSFGECGWCE